jgi:hypothetical protein
MAAKITLLQEPNQETSFLFENQRYVLRLNALNPDSSGTGLMAATVDMNEVRILDGTLITSEEWVIPYPYLEGDGGNLIFTATGQKNIWYEEFNKTQFLYYFTASEVAESRS